MDALPRSSTSLRPVLICALLLLTSAGPRAATAQVFSGTGAAVMGTSMTPEGTQKLAFEKARQSALEQFGAHVLSSQSLTTLETPEGIDEISTSRISVLAAGETRLVDGSKTVQREMTDEAVLYRVRARFRIEPTDFEKTLRAYLQTGQDAPLQSSVEDAVRLQKRLTRVGEGADAEEVRQLIRRTKSAYEQVDAAVDNVDGKSVRSRIARQRRQRKNALLRFFRGVKEHGHPQDALQLSLSRTGIQDEGQRVQFTYATDYALTDRAHKVTSICRETRPTWAPDNSKDNGVIGRPATDGWLKQIFGDTYLDFEVTGPLVLYMLDRAGNVRLLVAKTSKGMMSAPAVRFKYGGCDPDRLLDMRLWDETWEFKIPTRIVGNIDRAVLAVSKWDYDEIARQHGFRAVERGIYARGQGQPAELDAFTYGRRQFEDYVDKYATKVKEMSSAP